MKRTIALFLVLMLGVSLFAQSLPTGRYTMTSMTVEGVELMDMFMELGLDIEGSYIELLSGGRFRMVMFGEGDEAEGSFRMNGDTIIFFSEDEDLTGKIQGSRITIEEEESKMVFERK